MEDLCPYTMYIIIICMDCVSVCGYIYNKVYIN